MMILAKVSNSLELGFLCLIGMRNAVGTGVDIGWCDEHQKRRGKLEKIGGRRIPFRFGTSLWERSVVTKISHMRRRKFKVWSPRGHGRKPLLYLGTFKPFPDSTSRWISLSVRMLSLKASIYWSALTEDLRHCQIASVKPLWCIDRRFLDRLVCLGYSTGQEPLQCFVEDLWNHRRPTQVIHVP